MLRSWKILLQFYHPSRESPVPLKEPVPRIGIDTLPLAPLRNLRPQVFTAAEQTLLMTITELYQEGGRGATARRLLARDVRNALPTPATPSRMLFPRRALPIVSDTARPRRPRAGRDHVVNAAGPVSELRTHNAGVADEVGVADDAGTAGVAGNVCDRPHGRTEVPGLTGSHREAPPAWRKWLRSGLCLRRLRGLHGWRCLPSRRGQDGYLGSMSARQALSADSGRRCRRCLIPAYSASDSTVAPAWLFSGLSRLRRRRCCVDCVACVNRQCLSCLRG